MFKLIFDDGTDFLGKSLPKSEWKNAKETGIKEMQYKLGNKIYRFIGFKQYNHLLENIAFGAQGTSKLFLMARSQEETVILSINFIEKKIYFNTTQIGHEYGKQILTGWKEGKLDNPKVIEINLTNKLGRKLYGN